MHGFNRPMDRKLIQLVKSHPAVYDTSRDDYRKLVALNTAWEEIAAVMNKPAEECRHRWKDIRDQYRKFIYRKSSSNNVNSKYNNVQLQFLDKFLADKKESNEIVYLIEDGYQTSCVIEKNPTIVSYQSIPGGNSLSTIVKDDHNSGNTNSKRQLHHAILSQEYTNGSTYDISYPESTAEEMPHEKPLKRKSRSKLDLPKMSKKLKIEVEEDRNGTNGGGKEIVNVITQKRPVPEEENPIHTFFRSMASTVMTFPVHLIAETRMEVCNIVSRMELRALMED